jgi:hypothetical protein
MKLTNDQIFTLGIQGIGKLNYGKLEPIAAMRAYRFRRDIVRIIREIEKEQGEIKQDVWEDKELLQRVIKYEQTHKGMTDEEYKAAIEANLSKAQEMLVAYGREERDIAVQPIAFPSWLQLLKDNPWLAGWEETLADLISDNEM